MSRNWSKKEVQEIVSDYFAMLVAGLNGDAINKAEHRRELLQKLDSRSHGAIEYKHQNISAAMIEMGLPYISGYKPMRNYQTTLLPQEIEIYLQKHPEILEIIQSDADKMVQPLAVDNILSVLEESPGNECSESAEFTYRPRFKNYLVREINNISLGFAGELFALQFEQAKLIQVGKEHLAERVEHVSQTQGDGLGYDIRSFKENGSDQFIEVKTTKYGKATPFYLTENELRFSKQFSPKYSLYRIFNFRQHPNLFVLDGDLESRCRIKPIQYVASL